MFVRSFYARSRSINLAWNRCGRQHRFQASPAFPRQGSSDRAPSQPMIIMEIATGIGTHGSPSQCLIKQRERTRHDRRHVCFCRGLTRPPAPRRATLVGAHPSKPVRPRGFQCRGYRPYDPLALSRLDFAALTLAKSWRHGLTPIVAANVSRRQPARCAGYAIGGSYSIGCEWS